MRYIFESKEAIEKYKNGYFYSLQAEPTILD